MGAKFKSTAKDQKSLRRFQQKLPMIPRADKAAKAAAVAAVVAVEADKKRAEG